MKCYKIVRTTWKTGLWSVGASGNFKAQYIIGRTTFPYTGTDHLFVFLNIEDARKARKILGGTILEGTYTGKPKKYEFVGGCSSEGIVKFWKNKRRKKRHNGTRQHYEGTYGVESFTPENIIE
jgi:hypothetical protein